MVPASIVVVSKLPLSANGKVDRKALPIPDVTSSEREYIAPATKLEKELAAVWSAVLGVERIGVTDDFFRLGGDSIASIKVASECRKRRIHMTALLLFSKPTIRQLSGRDVSTSSDLQLPAVVPDPAHSTDPFPLSDVQLAYWIGLSANFEYGNVSTHSYMELALRNTEVARLEAAFNQLIGRHGMLRTIVQADGMQRTLAEVPYYRFAVTDVRQLSEAEREAALHRSRDAMSHMVHNTEAWPLFSIAAHQRSDELLLLVSIDLIIMDASSLALFLW